jgi:O-antigen/teichoic acid export membrane protein
MLAAVRSRNFINTIWNVIDTLAYPAMFFLLTPFFLKHLGDKEFGIYTLSSQMVVYIQILNFGLGTATFINVARNKALNNHESTKNSINTNLSFMILVFGFSVMVGLIMFCAIQFGGLYKIDEQLKAIAAYSIMLGILVGAVKLVEQIPLHAFKGIERFDIASFINTFFRLSILAINVVLVYYHFRVQYMWLSALIISLLGLVVLLVVLKRKFPAFSFSFNINFDFVKQELGLGLWLWLQTILIVLAYRLDLSLLPYLDNGLAKVTYYGLCQTIFNHIHMVFIAGALWVFPRFTALVKRGDDIVPLYRTIRSFITGGGLLALCVFSVLKEPIFNLWVGAERYLKFNEFLPLYISFEMFYVLTIIPLLFLNSTGNEKKAFLLNLVLCGLSLLFILSGFYFIKTPQSLLWGLITATIISVPVVCYYINNLLLKGNVFEETFIILIPSALAFGFTLTEIFWQKALLFALLIIAARFILFSKKNFDYRLLLK